MVFEEKIGDFLERGRRSPECKIGGGVRARCDRAENFLRAIARLVNSQRAVATDGDEAFGCGRPVAFWPIANYECFCAAWVDARPEPLELAIPNEVRFGQRLGLIDRPFRESDRGAGCPPPCSMEIIFSDHIVTNATRH